MNKFLASLVACVGMVATIELHTHAQGPKSRVEIATYAVLPSLPGGGPSEALAVDDAGATIVGTSWDRYDALRPVKWSLQNGSWIITSLPYSVSATSAISRSVNNQGRRRWK